jgi:xylitol oxidase
VPAFNYGSPVRETNWAGTHTYRASRLHRPSTIEELQELVARKARLRVLGSRHSFSDIADSDELVSLDGLPRDVEVDRQAGTVSVAAGLRYGELAEALHPSQLALHNLASLPHISVAGAVATATHGSGDRNGNLATAVAGLELVSASGELQSFRRRDADFEGLVVGLGALGVVIRITLDVEPAYVVRQQVFEGLRWDVLHDRFDEVTACGDSVSLFTQLGQSAGNLLVKSRVRDGDEALPQARFGAPAATAELHPIAGIDPVHATAQLGVPGRWSDRLPHFRMGFTPSRGDEIQSEYHVPRAQALAAIDALRALQPTLAPLLLVAEVRTVAADALWLSPQHGRDSVALHFTFRREPAAVARALAEVEAALDPFEYRPHWGKVFLAGAETLAPRYERATDFARLARRLDPERTFVNAWLERALLGRGETAD